MAKSAQLKLVRAVQAEFIHFVRRPRRVLFDHLPKCAGITVSEYLLMHYPRRLVFRTDGRQPSESIRKFRELPISKRHGYHLIIGHLTNELLDFVHPDTITLTILRDPVDRIVSHYFFVKEDKKHYLHDRVVGSKIQLEDYATSELSSELRNWYTTHFSGLSVQEAEKAPEESLRKAMQTISKRYNVIGFQDDLQAVACKLRNTALLYKQFDNQVRNKTRNRIRVEEVPENVRKTIAAANSLDVELYSRIKHSVE